MIEVINDPSIDKSVLFYRLDILKSSEDAEWLQNSKLSATELFLGLTCFFG